MEQNEIQGQVTLGGIHILLAEDNLTNQMVQVQMLESLGAEVTLAVDGVEALGMLSERPFDAALIDIEMPRMSGIEVIQRVRAGAGPAADMPMIALTAYVMREQRTAIESAGADGIIAKPILSIDKFGTDILDLMRSRKGAAAQTEASRPATNPEAEIDRAIYDRLFLSFDPAARAELKARVIEDIGAACSGIAAAVRDHDFGAIRAASHVLISVAGVIGAVRLQSLAQSLHSAGRAADGSTVEREGSSLLSEAERVLKFVRHA